MMILLASFEQVGQFHRYMYLMYPTCGSLFETAERQGRQLNHNSVENIPVPLLANDTTVHGGNCRYS